MGTLKLKRITNVANAAARHCSSFHTPEDLSNELSQMELVTKGFWQKWTFLFRLEGKRGIDLAGQKVGERILIDRIWGMKGICGKDGRSSH